MLLTCHPRTPGAAVKALEARVSRAGDRLDVVYTLEGDIAQIRVPGPRPSRSTDELWQHTCFEMFIRGLGARAYREFNFSPSGEWAVYDFERYREPQPSGDATVDPRINSSSDAGRLELHARVHCGRVRTGASLSVGLAAVIEETNGTRSYWALAHPADKPDFHHPDAFTLALGEAGASDGSLRPGPDRGQDEG